MKPKMKIEFAPDSKINNLAHKIVQQVYDIEGSFLTNYSSMYDFEESLEEFPGHKLVRFTSIPLKDRGLYEKPSLGRLDRYWVWYPPLTPAEENDIQEAYRRTIIKKLERVYDISFKDYPNNELYIWEVAQFLISKLTK